MRKLKLQVQVSADGYMAGPNGEMDFLEQNWDEGIQRYVEQLTAPVDTIVLGRKLAEGFIPHWAAVAANPQDPQQAAGRIFTDLPKVVFTHSLAQSPWANAVLASGPLTDEIARLKSQAGRDIIAYGGVGFVSALVQHGLIDEYHLFVNPTARGRGQSPFQELGQAQALTLVKATPFDCGMIVLHYAPKSA